MPSSLGPAEILVILVVALIVLGPEKLPDVARQVGKAVAEVRRWSSGMQAELRDAIDGGFDPAPNPAADFEAMPPQQAGSAPADPALVDDIPPQPELPFGDTTPPRAQP